MTVARFLPYVAKTVLRARVRSLLTVVGTALALALFAFVRTLEAGVDALNEAADAPVLVVFQQSRFCPLTSELPTRYRKDVEAIEGVEAVLPTLLYINACRSNLDLVALHGVDAATLTKVQDLRAVAGDLESWKEVPDGALVGKRLAERRRVKVGDRVLLGNVNVTVRGIVDGAGAGVDNVAFVHLEQLQLARELQGKASELLVRVKPGADAHAIARQIDAKFKVDEAPTDTKTMQAFVQGAVGEISELVTFARVLGYLAVLVVVLILGNTVFISAQTRAGELGVMETLGLQKASLAVLLTAESLCLALVGGVLGTAAVVVGFALFPTTLGIEGYGIDFVAGVPVAVAGLVASVVVGLLAAVGPAVEALTRPLALAVRPT
jgi:putative ABC transport system permease protein